VINCTYSVAKWLLIYCYNCYVTAMASNTKLESMESEIRILLLLPSLQYVNNTTEIASHVCFFFTTV